VPFATTTDNPGADQSPPWNSDPKRREYVESEHGIESPMGSTNRLPQNLLDRSKLRDEYYLRIESIGETVVEKIT